MELSQRGEDLIKSFESLALVAYQDQRGIWTCGWGHTGAAVVEGTTCDAALAEVWFAGDTAWAVAAVLRTVDADLNQNQFDAVVSFTFNVGVGNEAHSTLVQLLNAGQTVEAAQEFGKWVYCKGAVDPGLVRRRAAEANLFTAPVIAA